jgi:[acyl-carrier-protein] S-malonyltransferase
VAWRDHPAWAVVERAEAAVDQPLGSLVLDATSEQLKSTSAAQLSVLLASLMAWEALAPQLTEPPSAWAGHSLGQVTALIASGTVGRDDGFRFAVARAHATQRAADQRPGAMAALLGADDDQAANACAAAPDRCWVANLNAEGQIVIAGTPDGVAAASARAGELGVRRVRTLDVGGAFHTPLMSSAVDELAPVVAPMAFSATDAPVVTNHDALAHQDGAGWPERLTTHLVAPVRWADSVSTMVDLGADTFIEVGPGSALAGLIRRIAPEATVINVAEPADVARVPEAVTR